DQTVLLFLTRHSPRMNAELEADYSDFLRFPEVPPPFVAGCAQSGACSNKAGAAGLGLPTNGNTAAALAMPLCWLSFNLSRRQIVGSSWQSSRVRSPTISAKKISRPRVRPLKSRFPVSSQSTPFILQSDISQAVELWTLVGWPLSQGWSVASAW